MRKPAIPVTHKQHHVYYKLILCAVVLSYCVSCSEVTTAGLDAEEVSVSNENRVLGEYILTVDKEIDEAVLRALYKNTGVQLIKYLSDDRILIKMKPDPGLELIKQKAAESKLIKQVQPNYRYRYE